MEHNAAGRVGADSIVALLRNKLPEDEVNLAVQETLMDTAMGHSDGLDFDAFERFLRFGSYQDLSGGSPASAGRCK
ncbi:protein kinase domain-containing protein, partial [Haematococcus lacustris]